MRKSSIYVATLAALALFVAGCAQSEQDEFKSQFDEAVKAAEKGKELVKSPVKKR